MTTWQEASKRHLAYQDETFRRAFRAGWLDQGAGRSLRVALAAPDGMYRSGYYWGQVARRAAR